MSITYQEYSVDQEIADFFQKTTATRHACEALAKELVGGDVAHVPVQGSCSYTVYAGSNKEFVVQFRLKSLALRTEISDLAGKVYGSLVPEVSFRGEIGDGVDGRESLYVYVMSRVRGISQLDFVLAHNVPENSPEYFAWRENLVVDVASFFATAWKNPQTVNKEFHENLHRKSEHDLRLLLVSLPARFRSIVQRSLDALPAVLSLPMTLLHRDFAVCNIMVDATSNHLVGVIDWAEGEIGPFGTNLYSIQQLMGKHHLRDGFIRFADYSSLLDRFWCTLREEAGGLSEANIENIRSAMVVGLLLSHGFTSRLANMPEPQPIRDDESGAYQMLYLDGLLIDPATRIIE